MSDWMTIQHEQSGLVMVPLHQAERVRDERDRLKADIAELKDWKESALSMLNGIHLQAVAKELNTPLAGAIGPSILPGIRALKVRVAGLEAAIKGLLGIIEDPETRTIPQVVNAIKALGEP